MGSVINVYYHEEVSFPLTLLPGCRELPLILLIIERHTDISIDVYDWHR